MLKKLKNKDYITLSITFFFALTIWVLIYNYNDPVVTESYSVKVNLLNEDDLIENSKVYKIIQGENVSLKIKAKQSFFDNITEDDIIASADLSNLSEVNATSINVKILNTNESDWEVINKYPEMLKVDLDEYVDEQFSLEVNSIGILPEDKYLKDFACSPSMVTISGPKSIMSNIYKVLVKPNLTNAEQGYNTYCDVIVIDENGKNITNDYNLDTSSIKVSANILTKKSLPININVIDNVPIGYEILSSTFEPIETIIAGSKFDTDKLNELNINYTVNQIDNIEKTIYLEDYLPSDLIILENNEVTFKAEIAAFSTKDLEITSSDINVKNLNEKLKVYSISMIDNLLSITGPTEALENINVSDFDIYVDAEKLNSGKLDITCNVSIDEEFKDIQIISSPSITLNLKKK